MGCCTKDGTKKIMLGAAFFEDGDCFRAFRGCPECNPELPEVEPYYGSWKIKRDSLINYPEG